MGNQAPQKKDDGTLQGVVLNESAFPVSYVVYGANKELKTLNKQIKISPKVAVNIQGGSVQLEGFSKETKEEFEAKYGEGLVEVQPGQFSLVGLSGLKPNEHKISAIVHIGQFSKQIVKNIVIRHQRDCCLKIRADNLSVKAMQVNEAKDIIQKNQTVTAKMTLQQRKKLMQQRKETQTETAKVLDDAYQHPSKLGYN